MVERQHAAVGQHQISWLQAGQPTDPVALFLHGIPAGAELWREILPN